MNDFIITALDTIQDIHPLLRTVIAGLAIMLETSVLIGLIVPGDTVVLVAATAVDGLAQYFWMIAAVVIGALIGESVGFAIGRFFGPRLRSSWLGRKIGIQNWDRAANYIDRRGGIGIFLSRFLPVLHSLVPLTVGMSSFSYKRFIMWTLPACILWSFAYVSVGSAASAGFREVSRQLSWAAYLFVAAIVLFIVVMVVIKKSISWREAKHMTDDN